MDEKDIAPALLKRIRADFLSLLGDEAPAADTYAAAADYAERVGAALAEAFRRNLTADALPDGRLYWNIADRVVRPLLEEDHALIADASAAVQLALNQQAGIGIAPQHAALNTDAVNGLLNKLAEAERFEDAAWVLDEPVRTFSRMVVDDTLEKNVSFQGRAGLQPRVIRTAESHCCKWCSALAGTYDYPHVPKDVYRRHERCRCWVEYDPGEGRRQNVWSKTWAEDEESRQQRIQKIQNLSTNRDDSAKIESRKQIYIPEKFPVNPETGKRYQYHELQFTDAQFGKKIGKHTSDFGMDPSNNEDREAMRTIIKNIADHADERFYGEWRGQEYPVLFHVKGDDVVIESKNGEFVTILKGGTTNARVENARKRKVQSFLAADSE